MSTDPEDSLLEEALRQDFPSTDAQTRVRRRLLAAGVAVGNGMAVGSAAAAGGASGATSLGVASKALAMSWGVKLGVMAAVAVPAVGLLVENQLTAPAHSAPAAVARQAPEPSPAARPAPERAGASSVPARAPSPNSGAPAPSQRSQLNAAAALLAPAPAPAPVAAPAAPQPSRGSFEPAEPSSPSRVSTLADETRLLDAAFAELAAGNASRAAALISEHERRFPQGLLLKERQRAKLRLSEISGRESEGGRE